MITLDVMLQLLGFGTVLGGIYALASLGLGLAWGLMHVVNFAHGEWIMIPMYLTYWLSIIFGLDPYLIIPINMALGALIGFASQVLLFEPASKRGGGALMTILSTMGLSLFMIGVAQALWKQTFYSLPNPYIDTYLAMGPVSISEAHMIAFAFSCIAISAIYLFFKKTLIGKAILATSEIIGDPEAASIMGINTGKIRVLSMMIAGASTGIAGTLIATFYYIYPNVGITWCLLAFVIVIMGGLGSFQGLFIGGVIVGILEAIGSLILGSAHSYILVYAVYLLFLYLRPKGLMGRR